MKVLLREQDLSDEYIRFAQQIGADGFDIHDPFNLPGVVEQGYPDREALGRLLDRIRAAGLRVYRVAPQTPVRYLKGEPGGEEDVDRLKKTLEVFGVVGIPFMSMPIHLDNPGYRGGYAFVHRGGYTMHGFDMTLMRKKIAAEGYTDPVPLETHWERSVALYGELVPVAERVGVRLITHPSDPPLPDTDVSPRKWFGLMDAVPSDHNGLLFCIGTRYESGTSILDDIRTWGRKGKIFHTHFRNVRGTIPSAGGYQEMALDDGDMNMFTVLKTLRETGYDGGLQIDHLPHYDTDDRHSKIASAYAVGYVKALVMALKG
ncbi:MAG: mannonate dehydratase [candidate division Zixibacteria bacterium]|nr:mannonate dehydratase [candidate division Zixibacteria bacterium]